jgi:hypothetical protein
MPYQLQYEEVKVGDQVLMVWEASNLMDSKRSMMMVEAADRWHIDDEQSENQLTPASHADFDTEARKYLEVVLYPSLVACTTGQIPTLDEFINSVPAADTVAWTQAATRKNPTWFVKRQQLSPQAEAEALEKKGEPQISSSPA